MKVIDVNNWKRKPQYENFIQYTNPIFSVTTRIDVTNLVAYCKKNGVSFFEAFLYIASKSMNEVEEFRLRLLDGKVVLYDKVNPSFVVIREDESIETCLTEMVDDMHEFCLNARSAIEEVQNGEPKGKFDNLGGIDKIYVSCLPWIDITTMSNPYNFDNPEQSSIPRIFWGKYVERDGKYDIAFDIAAHHALADGYHAAKVVTLMEQMINNL